MSNHITIVLEYVDGAPQPAFHHGMTVLGGEVSAVQFDDALAEIETLEERLEKCESLHTHADLQAAFQEATANVLALSEQLKAEIQKNNMLANHGVIEDRAKWALRFRETACAIRNSGIGNTDIAGGYDDVARQLLSGADPCVSSMARAGLYTAIVDLPVFQIYWQDGVRMRKVSATMSIHIRPSGTTSGIAFEHAGTDLVQEERPVERMAI